MQVTLVLSLVQEDPLEEEMATYSSIFAWEFTWTEEASGLQSMGSQRVRHDLATSDTTERLTLSLHFHTVGAETTIYQPGFYCK